MSAAMVSCRLDVHILVMINHPTLKIICILFFVVVPPTAASLSFNYTSFVTNDLNMSYEGAADPASNMIYLTRNQRDVSARRSVGRATYAKPFQLWDPASGNLSDFRTTFTFVINSLNRSDYGDGLAFFLAPDGSRIPSNVTKGGTMALTTDFAVLNSTDNPFVAVEFDIYSNDWDPPNEHVGINVNSMRSVNNITWVVRDSINEGREHTAWIKYDSQSTNLSIVFTGISKNGTYYKQKMSSLIDLRDYLPEFVTIGFSASNNQNASTLHSITSWSFSSTLEPHVNETVASGFNTGSQPRKNNKWMVIGSVVGGITVLILVLGGLVGLYIWKKRKEMTREDDEVLDVSIGDEFEQGSGPKKFSYNELTTATDNFSQQEKLGEGGFGGVYRGFLKGINSYVAVKKVAEDSMQGIKEYASEVKIISRLRHRNLVQLLGWCHEKKELLLVYEFMPNGSLDFHLFKGKSLLNWETRFKIAHGLASALLYLHEEWEQCVVHRDIKSSNVMLDSNFNAKLGDFGLARLVDHEKGFQTTVLAGTMGYMAPECMITGKASKETDVYSFGIVALEIATGRRPLNSKARKSERNLVEWAWGLYGTGKILETADSKLKIDFNAREMECLMIVGLWCAHPDSNLRPSIRQAILVLNFEAPLPVLPLRMPVPTYSTPPADMLSSTYGTNFTGTTSSHGLSSEYSENTDSSSKLTSSSGALPQTQHQFSTQDM